MEIKKLLETLKNKHGLTNYRIAKETGVSATLIQKYLEGASYTVKTYRKILDLYRSIENK